MRGGGGRNDQLEKGGVLETKRNVKGLAEKKVPRKKGDSIRPL